MIDFSELDIEGIFRRRLMERMTEVLFPFKVEIEINGGDFDLDLDGEGVGLHTTHIDDHLIKQMQETLKTKMPKVKWNFNDQDQDQE